MDVDLASYYEQINSYRDPFVPLVFDLTGGRHTGVKEHLRALTEGLLFELREDRLQEAKGRISAILADGLARTFADYRLRLWSDSA